MARIAPELEFIGSNPVPQITPKRMRDGARGREINMGHVGWRRGVNLDWRHDPQRGNRAMGKIRPFVRKLIA
jgi:hypothetical protein